MKLFYKNIILFEKIKNRLGLFNDKNIQSDLYSLNRIRETPRIRWAYDLSLKKKVIKSNAKSSRLLVLLIEVEVLRGEIGVIVEGDDSGVTEHMLGPSVHSINFNVSDLKDFDLIFRNVSEDGSSAYRLNRLSIEKGYRVDLTRNLQGDLPFILRATNSQYKALVAKRLNVNESQIIEMIASKNTVLDVCMEDIFICEVGKKLYPIILNMLDSVDKINIKDIGKNQGDFDALYFKNYLKISSIRVYHLIKSLREIGIYNGRVLDFGSFLGVFSIPLNAFGYDVCAVDRYDEFNDAFSGIIHSMKQDGIEVVSTKAETEGEMLADLGEFDVVISMAVIEHIPHTPRVFLENLIQRLKVGGAIALDTPNLARHWSRENMKAGRPIMQELEHQFFSSIPFAGHHREYTKDEIEWMLRQCGVNNIITYMFDYNLLQFDKITGEHLKTLLLMQIDPTLMDTILSIGRKRILTPISSPPS